jgi:hypothetical protein
MSLVRLIYASESAGPIKLDTVAGILSKAIVNNTRLGITGFLCFGDGYFLQVLEGDAPRVNDRFSKIIRDRRHRKVELLEFRRVRDRQFSCWAMGDACLDGLPESKLRQFSRSEQFTPHGMDPEKALGLLKYLDRERRTRGERHGF